MEKLVSRFDLRVRSDVAARSQIERMTKAYKLKPLTPAQISWYQKVRFENGFSSDERIMEMVVNGPSVD